MTTCEGYQEQISQLIDHELGESDSPTLFAHLGACGKCRRFLTTTLQLRSGLQEQAPILASTYLDEKVLGRLAAKRRLAADRTALPARVWTRRISLPFPVAAVVILLLMLGSVALSSLWFRDSEAGFQTQTIYVTTLPAVEVQGYYSQPQTTLQ